MSITNELEENYDDVSTISVVNANFLTFCLNHNITACF